MPDCTNDRDELAALACQLRAAHDRIDQLQQAIESRGRIGQALGVLMCRYAIDAEAAFALMTRVSQCHNMKLRKLAEAVIEATTRCDGAVPQGLGAALNELLGDGDRRTRRELGST